MLSDGKSIVPTPKSCARINRVAASPAGTPITTPMMATRTASPRTSHRPAQRLRSHTRFAARPSGAPLRDKDDPPAAYVFPLPSVFHVGERYGLGIDVECAISGQRPELREGVDDGRVWHAATAAAPVELEPRAAQCRG